MTAPDCICDPKPDPFRQESHTPACRFRNIARNADAPAGQRPPDHPAERFRQEYPDEVIIQYDPPHKSERDELLNDLEDRIRRGVARLQRVKASYPRRDDTYEPEIRRLNGKIEGLRLVQDWLRSYRTGQ